MATRKTRSAAVDATRGASILNPSSYKKDALVQAWVDSRDLATVMSWLEEDGCHLITHLSQIIQETLRIVADTIEKGGGTRVQYTEEAMKILDRFEKQLHPVGRGDKNLLHNLMLDSRRKQPVFRRPVDPEMLKIIEEGERIEKERSASASASANTSTVATVIESEAEKPCISLAEPIVTEESFIEKERKRREEFDRKMNEMLQQTEKGRQEINSNDSESDDNCVQKSNEANEAKGE